MRSLYITMVWIGLLATFVSISAAEPRRVSGTITDENGPVAARLYIEDIATSTAYFARSGSAQGTAVKYDVKRSERSREQHVTLSAHSFEVDLPPGKYLFTVERGHEYYADQQLVVIPETGDLPPVELKLERWIDMAARGWYSGDTHLHRKLEEVPNIVAAEDLHVALPLTYWVRGAYERPSEHPISGHPEPKLITIEELLPPANRSPLKRFIWPINTEYELFTVNGKPHTQGAVFVLNHKTPLRPGAPPVGPVAQATSDQGAILDLDKHTWNWSPMIVPIMNVDLFELANNHTWRTEFLFKNWTADVLPKDWGIETDPQGYTERGWIDWGFKTYYAFLNCGFRMRPTAGTGSGVHPVPAGFGRVYVNCPGEYTYENWMEGLNAGQSFVTTGPMLEVTINGKPLDASIHQMAPGTVRVAGTLTTASTFQKIEVIVNGEVFPVSTKHVRVSPGDQAELGKGHRNRPTICEFAIDIPLTRTSWVAVRAQEPRVFEHPSPEIMISRHIEKDETFTRGERPSQSVRDRFRFAHTAAAHFMIDGPIKPRQREVNYFIQRMEQEIARNTGVLSEDEVAEYRKALAIYQEIAKRAVE